jgi:uncharacterized membrane protein YdjX (TVP38/TMEM64 family)
MNTIRRLIGLVTPPRLALGAALVLIALAGWWLIRTMGDSLSPALIRGLLADLGIWGPLALIGGLAAVLVIPIVPASILQIGAGLAFGPMLGLLYASVADILGASVGFWIARRWGNVLLANRLSPQSQQTLARLANRMSGRTVMLLRLIPGPAYPLVSIAAGYSPLGYGHYLIGSFTGVFPALVLLVFAGDLVMSSPILATALVVVIVGSMALMGHLINAKASETDKPQDGGPR